MSWKYQTKVSGILFIGLLSGVTLADDWPQWGGPGADHVWRETGIVERFDGPDLKPVWRTPIGGGYAGPAVAAGRVYVLDRQAKEGTERVLCLDEKTGKIAWKHEYPCSYKGISYDCGPRCTPTVAGDRVYAAGVRGHLFCFDAATGKIFWEKQYERDFNAKIPVWGIAAAPVLDGKQLLCMVGGKDNAAVVSFDKDTGKELWRSMQLDDIGYCPPTLVKAGTTRQLIIFHPEGVTSLDPAGGKQYWTIPWHTQFGVTISRPVLDGDRLFASQYWIGPLMLRLGKDRPSAEVLWKDAEDANHNEASLNTLMCTPIIRDGYIYGIAGYGALRCIKADTGERVWETYEHCPRGNHSNAFLIPNGDRSFIATEQGNLIIARLSPKGYEEISRAKLIEPTGAADSRKLVWSHPAFADRRVFARNDKEILCVDLAAKSAEFGAK